MAKPDFDATWVPRIGIRAAGELRRLRRIGLIVATIVPVVAIAAGVLFAAGGIGNVLGALLVVVLAACIVSFIRAQIRLAAAMSDWFGVKVKGLPLMNTNDFDSFCRKQGLRRPDDTTAIEERERGASTPT